MMRESDILLASRQWTRSYARLEPDQQPKGPGTVLCGVEVVLEEKR